MVVGFARLQLFGWLLILGSKTDKSSDANSFHVIYMHPTCHLVNIRMGRMVAETASQEHPIATLASHLFMGMTSFCTLSFVPLY
jgi:hypothetical protein